ncbi:hypothetical protein IFM89_000965 [Coptis chinensis]|uniref:Zinc knuckle CX2CX4HX4C domain-containing protein n=1 Tax=Coptis chinensis TaxID=261450 RepID=A0A835II53_9MAGN|nr:hypothetical protein IFM89_000965 [Coptis chinensis]
MDNATAKRTRINYARVCVVVDIKFGFPSFIPVNLGEGNREDIGLDYDWIPDQCGACNIFGHSDENCPLNKNKDKPVTDKATTTQVVKPARVQKVQQRKPQQRWTPKKNIVQGQTSCHRDDQGQPIHEHEGQHEGTPLIISDDTEQPESNIRDARGVQNPTLSIGSEDLNLSKEHNSIHDLPQIIIHEEVQAANRFGVLADHTNDAEHVVELNNLAVVPFSANHQTETLEEPFEEVKTEFDNNEMVAYTTDGDEGFIEGSEEDKRHYAEKRSQYHEDSNTASEEEIEREYFSDHNDPFDEEHVAAGMLNSRPQSGTIVKTKKLSELPSFWATKIILM